MKYGFDNYNLKIIARETESGKIQRVAKIKEYPEIEGTGWTQEAALMDLKNKVQLKQQEEGFERTPVHIQKRDLTVEEAITNLLYDATVIINGREYRKQDFVDIIRENIW